MKKGLFLVALVVCMGIFFAACTTFQASGFQVGMRTSGTEVLGDFTANVWVNEFLGSSGGTNFLNLSATAMSGPIRDAIDKEIRKKNGTAAINITVRYRVGPIQYILNYITGTLWAPATVIVSGTVIRQN
jgi:hypothetical protein